MIAIVYAFILSTSSNNVPRIMKALFKGQRKQPQTAYNALECNQPQETSGDPTQPNPQPHSEAKHFKPSSESPSLVSSFLDGAEVLQGCTDATVNIRLVLGLTRNRDNSLNTGESGGSSVNNIDTV